MEDGSILEFDNPQETQDNLQLTMKVLIITSLVAIFLLTTKSFFFWKLPYDLAFILSLSPILAYLFLRAQHPILIPKADFAILLAFTLTNIYMHLPFREFSLSAGRLAALPLILAAFIVPRETMLAFLNILLKIIAAACFFALLITFLLLIGIDLPHLTIIPDFRRSTTDYYMLYPGTLVLNTQVWNLGIGELARPSGIFREPGHFAITIGIFYIISRYVFARGRAILAAAGLITFSPFFAALFLIENTAFRAKSVSKNMALFPVMLAITILAFWALLLIIPQELAERQFFKYVNLFSSGGITDILAERARGDFDALFAGLSTSEKLLGIGPLGAEGKGFFEAQASDYRAFILRYGYIGLALISMCVFLVFHRIEDRRVGILLILIFALIMSHRSWMVDEIWLHLSTIGILRCSLGTSSETLQEVKHADQ